MIPQGVDDTASFGGSITSAATVTLDVPRTVGTVLFDNSNAYTIAGTATNIYLTMQVSSGSAAITSLSGTGFAHHLGAIVLASLLTVTVNGTATNT